MQRRLAYLSAALVGAAWLVQAAGNPGVIDVQTSGHGPPLVFIPGVATPGALWDDTVKHLRDRYECHVVSIAGFGPMAPVKTDHLLRDVRDQIIAYVRAQELIHPTLIGHSLGGALALAIGESAPDLPGAIISVDGLPFPAALRFPQVKDADEAKKAVAESRQEIEKQTAAQFARSSAAASPPESEYVRRINQLCGLSDPGTVAQARVELFSSDFRPQLGEIKCPILVLGALADKTPNSSRAAVEKFYRDQFATASQTRFQFFEKARHYLMIDDPTGFEAALEKELARR